MINNATNSALLDFLSASQTSLVNPDLDPKDIKLDHRDTADLLAFMARLGSQLNYYDLENKQVGDWKSFFETDKHALLALIIEERKEMEWQRINDLLRGLPYTSQEDDISAFCWSIFEGLFNMAISINDWYRTFTQYHINESFQVYLKEIIWKQFSFALQTLYNLYHKALLEELITDKSRIDPMFRRLQSLDAIWNLTPFPYKTNTGSDTILGNIEDFTTRLESGVKDFYNLYQALRKEARKEFDSSMDNGNASPHIALIISFLKLYKYQQKELNKMVERHMKFYYHKVLDFHKKGASPDSAFLQFQLSKTAVNYTLPKQSQLVGGQDSKGNPILFETDKTVLVSPSQITDYLTIFSTPKTGESSERDLSIATVKTYDSPVVDKITGNFVSFPMFGNTEDNPAIVTAPATIGFAIASPDLMLEGGNREVVITFTLDTKETGVESDPASVSVPDEPSEPSDAPNTTEATSNEATTGDASATKDLTSLFDITLTGAKKWISPYCQSAILSDTTLVVTLGFNQSSDATAAYSEKIHGPGFDTIWPVMKATLVTDTPAVPACTEANAEVSSTPSPYGYDTVANLAFSSFKIDCIVTELTAINLVIGGKKMPATAAAAPFGAVPELGTRFLVSSYEVFIKNTANVCFSTNWVNLPDETSYSNYYYAYNEYLKQYLPEDTPFSRDAYKAEIQWLDQGKWQDGSTLSLFDGDTCPTFTLDFNPEATAPVAPSGTGSGTSSGGPASEPTNGSGTSTVDQPKKRGFLGRLLHKIFGSRKSKEKTAGSTGTSQPKKRGFLGRLLHGFVKSEEDKALAKLKSTITHDLESANAPATPATSAADTTKTAATTPAPAETDSTAPAAIATTPATTSSSDTATTSTTKRRGFLGRLIHGIFGGRKDKDKTPASSTGTAAGTAANSATSSGTSDPTSSGGTTPSGGTPADPEAPTTAPSDPKKKGFWHWLLGVIAWIEGHKEPKDLSVKAPPLTLVTYPITLTDMVPDYDLASPVLYTDQSKSGFFAFSLNAPELAFGNLIYPKVVSSVTLQNTILAAKKVRAGSILSKVAALPKLGVLGLLSKAKTLVQKVTKTLPKLQVPAASDFAQVPNKPYTPKIKDSSLSYQSSVEVTPGQDANHLFYQVHPYGNELASSATTILPDYPEWGYVFLAFDQLQYNTSFTLFFGIEDRLETKITENFKSVTVELLTETGWVATNVLSDSTYGLNITGIVNFQISEEVSNENPVMPVGSYWIRLSADKQMADNAYLTMIGTNACQVKRVIDQTNASEALTSIPAGGIKNFVQPVSAINKTTQPFDSFGGEEPENQQNFYQRVSERVSHKGRGTSIADYQSLILQKFKEIYQVNVVPGKYGVSGTSMAQIDIAVVPVVDSQASTDPYRPIAPANDLSEVMSLLKERINPHLELEVQHAGFEEVLFSLDVTFLEPDQYFENIDRLNSDLKDFMSPWILNNKLAHTREALYTMELIKFIRSRKYVTSFQNLNVYLESKLVYGRDMSGQSSAIPQQLIAPKDPLNILIPAAKHNINAMVMLPEQEAASPPSILSDLKPVAT